MQSSPPRGPAPQVPSSSSLPSRHAPTPALMEAQVSLRGANGSPPPAAPASAYSQRVREGLEEAHRLSAAAAAKAGALAAIEAEQVLLARRQSELLEAEDYMQHEMQMQQQSLLQELESSRQREEDARSALRLNQLSIDARRKAASQRDQNAVVSVRCRLDDVGYDRAIASLQMGIYEKALAAFHERMASVGDEYNGGGGAPDVGDHGHFSAADYTPGAGPTPRTAHRGGGGMMSPTSSSGLNMRGEYGAW